MRHAFLKDLSLRKKTSPTCFALRAPNAFVLLLRRLPQSLCPGDLSNLPALSPQDLSAEETSLILLGNKTDLCPDPDLRVIKPETGATLASDCAAFYQECSALKDMGVGSAIELMAELLLQREDVSLERALTLVPDAAPRKRCCKK